MLEIACFNATSAIVAARAGADRIELCADYMAGGITPSYESLQQIRKDCEIPTNVMIRPRAGDFVYTDAEFNRMKSEIQLFKSGASGFVLGILDKQNQVDQKRNRELVELAAPLPCTFHRALDQVPDLIKAAECIIEIGFKSVLTSGGGADAISGAEMVAELHKRFGDNLSIILGGGVRSTNIDSMMRQTNVGWYHSAAITQPGEMTDEEEIRRLQARIRKPT